MKIYQILMNKKALEDCYERIEKLNIKKEQLERKEHTKDFPITKNYYAKITIITIF